MAEPTLHAKLHEDRDGDLNYFNKNEATEQENILTDNAPYHQ